MMSFYDRFFSYASDGKAGYEIANNIFDAVIASLRRDPRFRNVPRFEIELLLADDHATGAKQIVRALMGRVHIDDIAGEDQ